MVTSQDWMLEGKRLEKEIDGLRERWHEVNFGLRYDRNERYILRHILIVIGLYFLRRDIEKRVYELKLQRNIVQNFYMELQYAERQMVH